MTKNTHCITFWIDHKNKIVIPLQDPINTLEPIYEETIVLYHSNHEIIISDRTIYHDMSDLAAILKKALQKDLLPHPSITEDIGYLYNHYHYHNDNDNFTMHAFPTGVIEWIGYLYHMWESSLNFDSWIYNSPDGSIIFEITPFYPYMYCEPEEEENYIPFEEWIKTYKPYFITTLSQETALQWLAQAERIIKIVEFNQIRWELRSKIDSES
jgi:hypothetical protein